MKILILIIAVILAGGQAGYAENRVLDSGKPTAWEERGFYTEVGRDGQIGSSKVDPRAVADLVDEQNKARLKKFNDIKDTARADNEGGTTTYVTADGVRHVFGNGSNDNDFTVEQFIARQGQIDAEFDAGARAIGADYQRVLDAEKNNARRAAEQAAIDLKEEIRLNVHAHFEALAMRKQIKAEKAAEALALQQSQDELEEAGENSKQGGKK